MLFISCFVRVRADWNSGLKKAMSGFSSFTTSYNSSSPGCGTGADGDMSWFSPSDSLSKPLVKSASLGDLRLSTSSLVDTMLRCEAVLGDNSWIAGQSGLTGENGRLAAGFIKAGLINGWYEECLVMMRTEEGRARGVVDRGSGS